MFDYLLQRPDTLLTFGAMQSIIILPDYKQAAAINRNN